MFTNWKHSNHYIYSLLCSYFRHTDSYYLEHYNVSKHSQNCYHYNTTDVMHLTIVNVHYHNMYTICLELEEEWLFHQPAVVMYASIFKDVSIVAILRLIQISLHTISVEVSVTMANIHSTILRDLLCTCCHYYWSCTLNSIGMADLRVNL